MRRRRRNDGIQTHMQQSFTAAIILLGGSPLLLYIVKTAAAGKARFSGCGVLIYLYEPKLNRLLGSHPFPDGSSICRGGKPLSRLPVAGAAKGSQCLGAVSKSGGGGGTERNDGFSCKVVCLDECFYGKCGSAPPDGVADIDGIVGVPIRYDSLGQRNIVIGVIMLPEYPAVGIGPA